MKQGPLCLDTLSSTVGGGVGLYHCHGEGGNQVGMDKFIGISLAIRKLFHQTFWQLTATFISGMFV